MGGHHEKRYNVSWVMLNRKVTIDPHQIAFVSVRLDSPAAVTYAVEPVEKASLLSPSTVVQGNDEMTFCLLNMSPRMRTLSRNAEVARATEVDAMMIRREEHEDGVQGDLYIVGEEECGPVLLTAVESSLWWVGPGVFHYRIPSLSLGHVGGRDHMLGRYAGPAFPDNRVLYLYMSWVRPGVISLQGSFSINI